MDPAAVYYCVCSSLAATGLRYPNLATMAAVGADYWTIPSTDDSRVTGSTQLKKEYSEMNILVLFAICSLA